LHTSFDSWLSWLWQSSHGNGELGQLGQAAAVCRDARLLVLAVLRGTVVTLVLDGKVPCAPTSQWQGDVPWRNPKWQSWHRTVFEAGATCATCKEPMLIMLQSAQLPYASEKKKHR